ncbi:BamA/OMP85 family outer membrane protein [Deinococcus arenicola]|uniref:Outer membrane protein assembly factor n=1 Tax=Deinococcus arenicola TaxID=2994950 RepID=A0ABU4DLP2_9DEIO|nr:POTRA domain-containing protein [Deinococcus sp. ZS9-10]MDV6373350.1 outer membrane protein assembly factor [Deinococcus sp. ZS9-10]
MRHPLTLAVTIVLAAPALAQAQTAGTVQAVTVAGTSDLLANFLRATLSTQPGAPLSSVNLRAVEQEVVATGYFKSAVAELRTVAGKDTLNIAVTANPTIAAVEASGLTFLSPDAFKKSISELLNIAPGATLNTQRIDQAKEALAQNYQAEGFPFTPSISATSTTGADGSVTITFVVDETAPVKRVEITGVTLLPTATLTNVFKPLSDAKKFTPDVYYGAVQQLQMAYDDAGYLQAGVDVRSSTLVDGVLKIKVIEAKVAAVDLSNLKDPTVILQTAAGQPVTLANLQADVRALANQTGMPVGFALQPNPANPAEVTVLFGASDVASGPVKIIAITGNTLVPSAALLAAVKTKTGDTYSPQLAQDDFMALRDAYRKQGFEISTRDAVTFKEGALTFNIREVKLVGYELAWQGAHRTKDRIILRELPDPGSAFNRETLSAALGRISRLGYVSVTTESVRSDPQNPENVTYVLGIAETSKGIPVSLGLTYDSFAGGFSGDAAYTNPNTFGLGHAFTVGIGAQQNDAGQNFNGSVNYTIPWLDLKFLDFQKNRTSLSFGVGSSVTGNNAIFTKSTETPATTGYPGNLDTGYDYTVRSTGFSVNTGRNLTKYLYGSVGAGVSYKTYYLETLKEDDKTTVEVPGVNGQPATSYTFDAAKAAGLLPESGLTTRLSGNLNYDSTTNPEFPDSGFRANVDAGYNFGTQGQTPLRWSDVEGGGSTYLGFGRTLEKDLGLKTKQQVFAVRANAGTILNQTGAPSGTGFAVGGGSTPQFSRQIRGLADSSLFGINYATASAEYRVDFGLKAGIAQGLYGVAFADAGSAWGTKENPDFSLKYGVGAGVQLNLGIGGALLPSLRFDYGYSPQNQRGQFYFRIGNFF